MANWESRIKLKDLLNSFGPDKDDELASVPTTGQRIALRIIGRTDLFHGTTFALAFQNVKTEASFNRVMDRLYDFCDLHRIWIE